MPRHNILALHAGDAGACADLTALRSEIDDIDDALIALMEQRLDRSFAISGLKRAGQEDQTCLRPCREQEVLARVARGAERMPKGAIDIIWRELMGVSLQVQQATALVLHAAAQPVLVTSLARLRFGCSAPIIVSGSPEEALRRARTGDAVAIVELNPLSGWWLELYHLRALSIFDVLREESGRVCAVAIGRVEPDSLPEGVAFPIISEASLRRRSSEGEDIRPLAISGHMRLCMSERTPRTGDGR